MKIDSNNNNHKNASIHSGHRQRLRERLLKYPDSLTDCELMEVMLFLSIPRKNTNGIAHNLFSFFGDFSKLLSANETQLKYIDGIGDSSALLIKLIAEIKKRAVLAEEKAKPVRTFFDYQEEVRNYFNKQLYVEETALFMYDKNHNSIGTETFTSYELTAVNIAIDSLIELLLSYRPAYIMIAHNHVVGSCSPSQEDLDFTNLVNFLAMIHNVKLLDHVIYTKDKLYSFYMEGKIKFNYTDKELNKILDAAEKYGVDYHEEYDD